jgi:hypothetical protein
MRPLASLIALLALGLGLAACTTYDPEDQPYAAHYCSAPPDQIYDGNSAVPHPMQCYQCGVCY